jgi:hypothetical protein
VLLKRQQIGFHIQRNFLTSGVDSGSDISPFAGRFAIVVDLERRAKDHVSAIHTPDQVELTETFVPVHSRAHLHYQGDSGR